MKEKFWHLFHKKTVVFQFFLAQISHIFSYVISYKNYIFYKMNKLYKNLNKVIYFLLYFLCFLSLNLKSIDNILHIN